MVSSNVKRYSLNQQVADSIVKMIERGIYKIGDKIPTETELMHMFDVSRNTIREAIQSLNQAGVLSVKQGDGTYVRATNRFDANMNMKYEEVSYEEISEARKSLEVTICLLAAKRRTKKDMDAIEKAFDKRKIEGADVKELTKNDIAFHMTIAKACHNKILSDIYQSLYEYLETHILDREMENNLDIEEIEKLHEGLLKAIREQDVEKAGQFADNIVKIS